MGVLNIFRKSRYPLNPNHFFNFNYISSALNPAYSANSSSGYPSFPRNISSVASKFNLSSNISSGSDSFHQSSLCFYGSDRCRNDLLSQTCDSRLCHSSAANSDVSDVKVEKVETLVDDVEVSSGSGVIDSIVDVVRKNESDMESRLFVVGSDLSKSSIIEVFHVLNRLRVPSLRFFEWVRSTKPHYSRNANICSLVIDNCGRVGDYSTLVCLLKDLRRRRVCLTEKAFGFLDIMSLTTEEAEKSISGVVGILHEVGGSCCRSGIHSLIALLCSLDLVDLAKFVMENTEKRTPYYCVLVKHMCKKGQIEGIRELFEEMRQQKCEPNSTAYNYLISSLCMQGRIDKARSVPDEMIETECPPDQSTFEILIYFMCRNGRSDDAIWLYNDMKSRGIAPRLSTHSAFIRGYVSAERFEEAYRYVVDAAAEDKRSAQLNINMLASLHIRCGDLLVAHNLLLEMIEQGLKPKHSVYQRALNRLRETGRSEIANSLEAGYCNLVYDFKQNAG